MALWGASGCLCHGIRSPIEPRPPSGPSGGLWGVADVRCTTLRATEQRRLPWAPLGPPAVACREPQEADACRPVRRPSGPPRRRPRQGSPDPIEEGPPPSLDNWYTPIGCSHPLNPSRGLRFRRLRGKKGGPRIGVLHHPLIACLPRQRQSAHLRPMTPLWRHWRRAHSTADIPALWCAG